MAPKTMFDKIWEAHLVKEVEGQPSLLYIDLHLVHEVTSPQAFDGLRMAERPVRRPDLTVAVADHNTPTWDLSLPITDPIAKQQLDALTQNCEEFGVTLHDRFSPLQGIVHVIGPEQGHTQPGKTIVCGDSHTSTHGAFGAFAIGIGTILIFFPFLHFLQFRSTWAIAISYPGCQPVALAENSKTLATIIFFLR